MADISRAMNTPPPAVQQPQAPQPAAPPSDNLPFTRQGTGEKAAVTRADNAAREAKNERDRLRRKEQRAAAVKAAKAAEKKAAAPKKKAKRRVTAPSKALMKSLRAMPSPILGKRGVKRRRGRPPGAKNKPKAEGLAVALVPAPGVLPRVAAAVKAVSANDLLAQIGLAVSLLNAMPEHARKVVLDAVK